MCLPCARSRTQCRPLTRAEPQHPRDTNSSRLVAPCEFTGKTNINVCIVLNGAYKPDKTSKLLLVAVQFGAAMPSPGAPAAASAGKGEILGHSTWHPQASTDSPGQSGPAPGGASTSLHDSKSGISRPGGDAAGAPKRSGFNMKVRLS